MSANGVTDAALLAARCLIGLLFVAGAVQKIVSPGDAQALLEMQGLPAVLVWPAFAFNAAAGLLLIAGVWVRPVAVVLAVYCGVTSFFHLIPSDPWQMSIFAKNWSIAGGCLALAVAGSGRLALRPDTSQGQARRS
ncbi:DoxX family protein [Lacimonas salitolerans]|uniref:DoxX family protein n=1 Tax=Lacimonas salitolerans TaxID=1323750 RepID=A0ABW4ECU7_9RHOB